VSADDVSATYRDGLLEVRLPMRATEAKVDKIPIAKD
jgi:HSP20 family molecular chaperone IbpA